MAAYQYALPSYLLCVALAASLVTGSTAQGAGGPQADQSLLDILSHSWPDNVQRGLSEDSQNLDQLLADIQKAASDCIGVRSELCEALELTASKTRELVLESAWSPGKRSALQDKRNSRQTPGIIRTRRACTDNLGFACRFEEMKNFMDEYNYLASADSPGKKRAVPVGAPAGRS